MHYTLVASNPVFRDFEKTFSDQIINPKDLIIKEQIGEGEYFNYIRSYVFLRSFKIVKFERKVN